MAKVNLYDIIMKDKETKDSPALSSYLLEKHNEKQVDFLSTNIIALNLLFSGKVNGGIPIGKISMISASSMLGKTFIAYGLVKSAQKKGFQVCIVDTERVFNFQFAEALDIKIDRDNLVVMQENGIEEVTTMIVKMTNGIPKSERKEILFVIDSWGSLITSKTMNDALTGNDVSDMTPAKKQNKLANIILNTRCTFFVVNHVYSNIGGYGDSIAIPGGGKIIFNSDCIVLGRSRAKEEEIIKQLTGSVITAETFKSRYSKWKSKLKYRIKQDGGLDTFFGILDDAIEGEYVITPKMGYYARKHIKDDKNFREKDIYNSEFWLPIFTQTDFKKYLENKYTFTGKLDMVKDEDAIETIINSNGSDESKEIIVEETEETKSKKTSKNKGK